MTHANAPLTAEGRRRLVQRCRIRPIAHGRVAALEVWNRHYNYHRPYGAERTSSPRSSDSTHGAPVGHEPAPRDVSSLGLAPRRAAESH